MKSEKIQSIIYFAGLILLVISLPFSLYFLSLSMIILTANWLIDKNIFNKIKYVFSRKSIIVLISIYFVHIAGLLFTRNFDYAFHDLKIKLPLLILPVIIGTSERLNLKKTKFLLLIFVASVFTSTIISFIVYLFQDKLEVSDTRNISVFISHIRFSLLVDLSIFILLYMALFPHFEVKRKNRIYYLISAAWLSFFLLILESFTGIVIFIIVLPVFIIYWAFWLKNKIVIKISIILVLSALSGITLYIYNANKKFYNVESIPVLDEYTPNGNKYTHSPELKFVENGHYVWLFINEPELEKEWNKVSRYKYDSLDKKGQEIKYTLIRYLTSKGLRKDSLGVNNLTPADIKAIENGKANYIFNKKVSIYPRLYQIIWEFDSYKKVGNASGHSLVQRIEYLKNGVQIIKRNFWTGVGTGDLNDEFNKQYESSHSKLDPKWRLRAHNQYITFFITFGITGFLWIIFSFFYPVFYERKNIDFLSVIFLLIAFLSMLNEDTLETHTGISFFAFFYSFFILGYFKKDGKETRK